MFHSFVFAGGNHYILGEFTFCFISLSQHCFHCSDAAAFSQFNSFLCDDSALIANRKDGHNYENKTQLI